MAVVFILSLGHVTRIYNSLRNSDKQKLEGRAANLYQLTGDLWSPASYGGSSYRDNENRTKGKSREGQRPADSSESWPVRLDKQVSFRFRERLCLRK